MRKQVKIAEKSKESWYKRLKFLKGKNGALIFICLFGVLFRLYLMLEFPNQCCASDEYLYVRLADNIITHGQFIYTKQDESSLWTDTIYGMKPPLYPYILAGFFSILGIGSSLVKILQIVLSVCTGILLYKSGEKIFSKKVGLIACGLFMFFWEVAYFSQAFYSENLQWFLMSLLLYLLASKIRHTYFYSGIVLGLYILTKPTTLLLIVPITYLLLWKSYSFQNIKNLIILLLMTIITLSPWVIRNFLTYKQFVPVYTDGGVNIWMGNYPDSGGGYNITRNNPKETPILHTKGVAKEIERDNFYYTSAFNYMKQNPVRTFELSISKIFLTFNPNRPGMINTATTTYRKWLFTRPKSEALNSALTHMIILEFVALQILSLLAVLRIFYKKKITKHVIFLLVILTVQLLSIMISHAETRYVMEMYPILFLFSAVPLSILF